MASLKVAVRVRPFNNREHEMEAKVIVQMDGKKTRLLKPKHTTIDNNNANTTPNRENFNDFTFDFSYWSFEDGNGNRSIDHQQQHVATQEEVYNDLGMDVINCAFQGYNACVFAYGQTGSGKTFTMMGTPESQGLIPRICKEMFNRMKIGQQSGTGYKTNVSYLEIYNERVKDLLGVANNTGHGLRVREHRTLGPYVEDLSQHPVADYREIQECIDRGNMLRTTACTNMNDTSSRSHAIFTITFVQAVFMDDMPSETVSKIHLVDLAGSERANATGATGDRLKEGAHINKSLVTLGSVISALAEQSTQTSHLSSAAKKKAYIPYRDSVLTWLLKDSLGGNSKTIMIAAISPADCNYSETLSTLRYANRAKNIINKPTINEDPNVKLIRELREEIMKLKGLLSSGDITDVALHNKSSQMLEDLLKKEAQEKFLTEEWAEKWRQAQSILREEKTLGLRKSGVGVVLDSEAPHLIGIHDDISTGVTLYSLKEGETIIGSNDENGNADNSQHVDIVLCGTGILTVHCTIKLVNGTAIIYPHAGAQCWLNANRIAQPEAISQGDILLLGRTNMFRYNNPMEAAKLRKGENRSRSRPDLSRLSLIAASRENLSASIQCFSDDDLSFGLMTNSMRKEHFDDIQEEHRKILETIENALHKLNTERTHIYEQHSLKVQQLTDKLFKLEESNADKLTIICCHEDLLNAKREMILWNKTNKKTQIDIAVKQISTLQLQLDAKKGDFQEAVAKELHELQNISILNELHIEKYDSSLMTPDKSYELVTTVVDQLSNSDNDRLLGIRLQNLIKRKRNEIDNFDVELIDKEKILKESIQDIAQLDEAILLIDEQQQELRLEREQLEITTNANNSESKQIESDLVSSWNGMELNSDLPENNNPETETEIDPVESSAPKNEAAPSSSLIKKCQKPQSHSVICAMRILRQNIAAQKAQIMKNLELNNCDKTQLDEDIAKLQQLQKQYFQYEKDIAYSEEIPNRTECCMSSDDGDVSSEDILRGIHSDVHSNSSESREDKEKFSAIDSDENAIRHSISYQSSSLINRSQISNNYDSEYFISIPSYVMRGGGKHTHFEYEIRITLPEDKWTLMRRYSRFRELHISLKSCYGEKVSAIPFPRRELFASKSESVARNRRRQLETYLRRLLVVCSKIPQCPFYEGQNGYGLSKTTLIEFSQFFKKGLFESGKYGTG